VDISADCLGSLADCVASGLNPPKPVEDSTEISALKCIVQNIDHFGTPSWKETVKFDDVSGQMLEAPLSLACFDLCWWEVDHQTDVTTGKPTSAATLAGIAQHQTREGNFKKLAAKLKICEEKLAAGTPLRDINIITDDFAPNTPAEFKTPEKKALCKLALELDECTNQVSEPVIKDSDEYNEIIPEHDKLAEQAKKNAAEAAAAAGAAPPA